MLSCNPWKSNQKQWHSDMLSIQNTIEMAKQLTKNIQNTLEMAELHANP